MKSISKSRNRNKSMPKKVIPRQQSVFHMPTELPEVDYNFPPPPMPGNTITNFSSFRHPSIVHRNKDTSQYTSEKRIQKIQELSRQQRTRSEITRTAKSYIHQYKLRQRSREMFRKDERFKLNIRREEVTRIKQSWAVLISLIGIRTTSSNMKENRKRLHSRAEKSLTWLFQISKCFGRIKGLQKRICERKAIVVLRMKFLGFVIQWVKRRKDRFRQQTIAVIENALTSDTFFKLMDHWKSKILFIQRHMRDAIRAKTAFNNILLNKWKQAELSKIKKKSKNKAVLTSSIPAVIKLYYIREVVWVNVRKYNFDIKEYYREMKLIKSKLNSELASQGLLDHNGRIIYPLPPFALDLTNIITIRDFKHMVNRANRERTDWEHIVNIDKLKIMKSRRKLF